MSGRVVALGFFDGVHIGHGELLKLASRRASETGLAPAVLTYSRHPSEILSRTPVKLINTVEEREDIIRRVYGIDDVIVRSFTREYAQLSCSEFVRGVLCSEYGARHVIAGYDFRFGAGGAGDADALRELCAREGLGCDIVERVRVDGITVSSTTIRALIELGDMKNALRFLGHRHCMISRIEHGDKIGAAIDFPTINQSFAPDIQIPRYGVYASRVYVRGREFRGVTNIGVRPTVARGAAPRAETNILDFSGMLYGEVVRVELMSFIRDEMRFDSVSSLRRQIAADVAVVRRGKYDI